MKPVFRVMSGVGLLAIAACSSADVDYTYPQDNIYGKPVTAEEAAREEQNTLSSALGIFDSDEDEEKQATGLAVNRYLWNASLDTLSFLPLQSTDPFGGVIVTDWGNTTTPSDERVKVTVRIDSPDLRASALTVDVYRQQRDSAGTWQSAPVAQDTKRQLEDSILRRARQLRIAELDQ